MWVTILSCSLGCISYQCMINNWFRDKYLHICVNNSVHKGNMDKMQRETRQTADKLQRLGFVLIPKFPIRICCIMEYETQSALWCNTYGDRGPQEPDTSGLNPERVDHPPWGINYTRQANKTHAFGSTPL